MTFNTYFVSIPLFLVLAVIFGSYNMKKAPMAICGFMVACVTTFSVAAESFRGLVQFFDTYNGFDVNPVYSLFSAMITIMIAGIMVGGGFYVISTRNSKRAAKKRNRNRADFGEFNELAYGKNVTPVELLKVYC